MKTFRFPTLTLFATTSLFALASIACGASGDDASGADEGAVEGVDSPNVAVPGTQALKSCGDGAAPLGKIDPAKINALITKEPTLSRVLDQRTGITLVPLVVGSGAEARVATWGPSATLFGQWTPLKPLSMQFQLGTGRRVCYECRGGFEDYPTYTTVALDGTDVMATWDAKNERFLGLHFMKATPPVVAAMKVAPDQTLSVSDDALGVFTLNCKVDAAGVLKCPPTTWAGKGSANQSFHDLAFEGRVTNDCVLVTSKNVRAGAPPPATVVGVAMGTRMQLGL